MITEKEVQRYRSEISDHKLFGCLNGDEQSACLEQITFKRFLKGNVIFDVNDKRDFIYVVLDGLVKIERGDRAGIFQNYMYATPNQIFPIGGMLQSEYYTVSSRAATRLTVAKVPVKLIERLIKTHYEVSAYLFEQFENILNNSEILRLRTVCSNTTTRITQALQYLSENLADKHGENSLRIPYIITHEDIATISGTRRETVGRVIQNLIGEGYIVRDSGMFIFESKFNKMNKIVLN
ncbi:Crp/Fnr family transcriptional regulator [Dellaglioa carnosa]|uniref:Crp/Fnr family transcriptional regulator n=1 Tax=Dellaglioa carnosa TaxID=2995136 RepID=UPI0022A86738|nr:Crp/Fnr family transcriptional regulator [Dellaglioa carnosa]MCZ2493259.1 Crp/Fnr family transcriptional regulator [Dellaglioa carnosa]